MVPCPTAARTPGVMRTVSYLGPAALCPGAIQDCYERLKTANFSLDMARDVFFCVFFISEKHQSHGPVLPVIYIVRGNVIYKEIEYRKGNNIYFCENLCSMV